MSAECDVLVVGGGPAGLSAALVLARARRSVLVADTGEPRNASAGHVHGFLSRDGISVAELLATGAAEVRRYGGEVTNGEVVSIEGERGGFTSTLADGRTVLSRRILLATGLADELPPIPGMSQRWGRDVLHCPYCHGWEFAGQPIGVLGGRGATLAEALLMPQWSNDIVILVHEIPPDHLSPRVRDKLEVRGVKVIEGHVSELTISDDKLTGVKMSNGTAVALAALMVFPLCRPRTQLLDGLGAEVNHLGAAKVDDHGRTTVPGVWAAGNAVDAAALVVNAASAGSRAAASINSDLASEEIQIDLRVKVRRQ